MEENNESLEPSELAPADIPGDPRLEQVASERLQAIRSIVLPKLRPTHLDLEQRKEITADARYRP